MREDYEVLFDCAPSVERLRPGVILQRTQTVRAGEILYVRCYPVWKTRDTYGIAKVKKKESREAQKKLNQRNAQLKLEQIVNANFGEGDIFATLTYSDDNQPRDGLQAQRDIRNFIKRVKTIRRRLGLDEIKYVYTTETTQSAKRGIKYHHHIIMSGNGMGREEIEKAWSAGLINTRRCQKLDGGLGGLANYMSKVKETQSKHGRRWSSSKNMKKPKETTADHKISLRTVERLAIDAATEGRRVFEKTYPGYRLIEEPTVKGSRYVPGAYIYAKLQREGTNKCKFRQRP